MARALGWEVTLFTTIAEGYDRSVLHDITVEAVPAESVTRFENLYSEGARRQRLIQMGEPLSRRQLSRAVTLPANVFLVAPALQEVPSRLNSSAPVSGLALQGPLRRIAADGHAHPRPDALLAVQKLVCRGQFAFLSEEDALAADELAARLARAGTPVFVTRGRRGASLFTGETRSDFTAFETSEIDPTGAGDCFATAFLLRLAETESRPDAIRYALAAGALAVTRPGLEGIPSRREIETLLWKSAA